MSSIFLACLLLIVVAVSSFPVRFWLVVRRYGKPRFDAAVRLNGHMLSLDVVTIFLAMLAFHWVGQDWFGLALPGMRAPHPQIMAIVSTCACMLVAMVNGSRRFDDATRVGMPEAVLRWLVTQQIITAAEVSAVVTSPIRIRREL